MPDTLHDREGCEHGHRVDRGGQQLDVEDSGPFCENEADGQYDHSDGARGDSHLALHAEGLSPLKTAVESLRIPGHVEDFTNGIVDTRQLFFYLTGCILALLFSILGVEAKMLNS